VEVGPTKAIVIGVMPERCSCGRLVMHRSREYRCVCLVCSRPASLART
jgi:hypothetical protein